MSGGTFSASVAKFVAVAGERANVAHRKILFGILSNVVVASPVDTGRFRGNWQVGLATRPVGAIDVESKDSGNVISRELPKITSAQLGGQVFITNHLPYSLNLEFGWSRQAPQGMVRLTFANLDHIVSEALK